MLTNGWSHLYFAFCFRALLFTSRAEEIAVLREFSETLVCNLLPESLWGQDVSRCALNEIVALKGRKALNSLSTGIQSCVRTKPPMTYFTSVWIVCNPLLSVALSSWGHAFLVTKKERAFHSDLPIPFRFLSFLVTDKMFCLLGLSHGNLAVLYIFAIIHVGQLQ